MSVNNDLEPTNEQRRVMYQARRGLKELDFYIDPYVKHRYLQADEAEQHAFAELLTFEDPHLLKFFMNQDQPENQQIAALIETIKQFVHDDHRQSNTM